MLVHEQRDYEPEDVYKFKSRSVHLKKCLVRATSRILAHLCGVVPGFVCAGASILVLPSFMDVNAWWVLCTHVCPLPRAILGCHPPTQDSAPGVAICSVARDICERWNRAANEQAREVHVDARLATVDVYAQVKLVESVARRQGGFSAPLFLVRGLPCGSG